MSLNMRGKPQLGQNVSNVTKGEEIIFVCDCNIPIVHNNWTEISDFGRM